MLLIPSVDLNDYDGAKLSVGKCSVFKPLLDNCAGSLSHSTFQKLNIKFFFDLFDISALSFSIFWRSRFDART